MRLSKGSEVVELSNEAHIHAYKANGWAEVRAEAPADQQPKASKPRARKPKAAE